MLERQDIDALLISALYGELTPADEARLNAHLESHPTDRTALADLTRARSAVKESRILEVQLEPPQAVSALLLQEAARRAPRRVDSEKRNWFQRLMMGLVAHPAMAAAAMLVIVVGAAGTMYLHNGADSFSDKTVANESSTAPAPSPDPAMQAPRGNTATADESGKDLAEAEKKQDQVGGAATTTATTSGSGSTSYGVGLADGQASPKTDTRAHAAAPPARPTPASRYKDGIVVNKEAQPAPRDLDDKDKGADKNAASTDLPAPGNTNGFSPDPNRAANAKLEAAKGRAMEQQQRNADAKAPAPTQPPPAAPVTVTPSTGGNQGAVDRRLDGKKNDEERKANEDITWAKAQFEQAKALVADKKCPQAAALVLAIQKRAPDYYNQTVATDIALKPCRSYVENARERDESQKSRAKRAEPAPASDAMH